MFYPVTVGDKLRILGRYDNPWDIEVTHLGLNFIEVQGLKHGRKYTLDAAQWGCYSVQDVLESSLTYRQDRGNCAEYWTHIGGAVIGHHKYNSLLAGWYWTFNGRKIQVKWFMQVLGELQ